MAFPSTSAPTETAFSSASTTHNVSMPATVNKGDLLLLAIGIQNIGGSTTFTTPSGWTSLMDRAGSPEYSHLAIFMKVADGTEGGTTVNVATSNSQSAVAQVYRVTRWYGSLSGVESADSGADGVTTPDPPSLTPSWGALDTLWFAWFTAADDDETVTAYPSNYSGGSYIVSGAGTNAGCEIGSARRELNATSDNPGSFTITGPETNVTATVAVRPRHMASPLALLGVGA